MLRYSADSATPVQPVAAPPDQESGPNASVQCWDTVRKDNHRCTGPFPCSEQGKWYLLIPVDYCTKWPEAHDIPNEQALIVAETLVSNVFGVLRQLHSGQGRNFESRLIQEILQRLGMSKTSTMSLRPQSDGMVERYIKTVEEHLQDVVASHQRDWNVRLPIVLLAHRLVTAVWAWPQLAYCSGENSYCPTLPRQGTTLSRSCGKFSGPSTRHPQLCPHNTRSWPVTGRKLVTTDWLTARATNCGYLAQPTRRGQCRSSNTRGRAHTR
jgi:hypothetical protein